MRGIVVAPVIACGLLGAMIPLAAPASATSCHSASCVPNVAKNVVNGTPCTPSPSFVFGMDAQNGTLICAASGVWMSTGPLTGEAENSLPCTTPGTTAQQRMAGDEWEVKVPGVPLLCSVASGVPRWAHFPPA
ncbi:hypothetical protein FHT40_003640 [Mycolicibacterium sp. BK556]|uniref:hypothetical protein n=1 Tax=Mycobacteriaceae TaxID=1762 RepID=UPI00105EC06D|nr:MULTISPECIES: hypothetical protein [Mycobacteriaceae]MBB3603979.1 hypothetical protein [Mycolicibacterium sp. BK556]MBB3634174.1 hypothetical protein [Mycolicibacterium sp. BK607]TDO12272.1 hypothetical protein EV580_3998 [Mycobacterium sp. BK086]